MTASTGPRSNDTQAGEQLWGAQTQLAIANFPISGEVFPLAVIHEIAAIKAAAARVNMELGALDLPVEAIDAIAGAARDVAEGRYDDQFPIDVFQTGSGTSSNMNVNEVVAALAQRRLDAARPGRDDGSNGTPISAQTNAMISAPTNAMISVPTNLADAVVLHPNDHVNASQSSNDVVPTAVHIAAARGVRERLIPALGELTTALRAKAEELAGHVKPGRTHLMDAVPVTLGQELGGHARAVGLGIERLEAALPRLCELPLGGTAVGTGLNAPEGFAARVLAALAAESGLPLHEAVDHFEAQGNRDGLVETSGVCRGVAVSLVKLANDLRWMGSGPSAGLGEIVLPSLQPGSSIMPGKVNPVLPEVVCQVAAQVIGNDAAVAFAGASGNFELNVMVPVMARNVLASIDLLAASTTTLARRCIAGITADADHLHRMAMASPAIVTALATDIGYDRAAAIVKEAAAGGRSIIDVVVEHGLLDRDRAEQALDVTRMAHPHGPEHRRSQQQDAQQQDAQQR